MLVLGILLIIIGLVFVWFGIPYFPVRKEYKESLNKLKEKQYPFDDADIFEESDFDNLPRLIKNYCLKCGYLGKKKMAYIRRFCETAYMYNEEGKKRKATYVKYNFIDNPESISRFDYSKFPLSIEEMGLFIGGHKTRKKNIDKRIVVNQHNNDYLDEEALTTYLGEIMFIPTALSKVIWEEIDDNHIKGTLEYRDMKSEGIFAFDNEGMFVEFKCQKPRTRGNEAPYNMVLWTGVYLNYEENEMGIKTPTTYKAIWNLEDRDFVYFDVTNMIFGYFN